MKITILGTNGFLSTALAKHCISKGYFLHMLGRKIPNKHGFDSFEKIDFFSDNFSGNGLLDSDVIVYAAGAGIQSNLNESYETIYKLNVTVPVSICKMLSKYEYKGTFVTFGSVFEMGETHEEHFFTENEIQTSLAISPNDYVVSKRMLTRFVGAYKHDFVHWHFIIPTVYGEDENPKRLIPYTINAIKNREKLHFTSGEQVRQYVYVNEIPRLLDLAIEKKLPSGIYNIQGSETKSVKEIVALIAETLGECLPDNCFGSVQRSDTGMKYLALSGKKIQDAIGFRASILIKDVICKY